MLRRRNLSPGSEKAYVKAIRFFCEYYKTRPEDLIKRFSEFSEDEIIEEFANFFASVQNRVASKTLWGWMPGIRAWLLENGVRAIDRVGREISREFRRKIGKVQPLLKRDLLEKQEIIEILKVCGRRDRAAITTFASSGLRLSACLGLQMKHIKDDIWNPNLNCYLLEIFGSLLKGGDNAEPYYTFISSEAAENIRNLLLNRKDDGEELTDESYLFISRRGGGQLSSKRFSNLFRELCREANLDLKGVKIKGYHPVGAKGGGTELRRDGMRYNIRVHSLRKFFKTRCSLAGVDRMASESLMGHSLNSFGVENLYDFCATRKDWLRTEYEKVLADFTFLKPQPIFENGDARAAAHTRREIMELQSENAGLLARIDHLESQERGSVGQKGLVEMLRDPSQELKEVLREVWTATGVQRKEAPPSSPLIIDPEKE